MTVQTWNPSYDAEVAPRQAGLLRRILAWRPSLTQTCTLDEHLAADVGQHSYQVPLFSRPASGGRYGA